MKMCWVDSLSPATEARIKDAVSHALRKSICRRHLSQKQMARRLGTSESCVSRALNPSQAVKMSFTQLFTYLARAEPKVEILISV